MCRLFGSTEARGVTRALLRDEFAKLSHANPQGHGLAFVRDGQMTIDVRLTKVTDRAESAVPWRV